MFTDIYRKYALLCLGVMGVHSASSGPDILLLLLKALISISAPFSPTRLTSWALSSSTDFSFTISCLSTGLNPVLSKRSRVAPRCTLSLSAFSARSDSLESLNQTQVSYEADSMFYDLMSKAKYLACILDTSITNELAGDVKYNQEERDRDGHAFSLLNDYLKFAEDAHDVEIA